MPAPIILKDGQAKQRMRDLWPTYAAEWFGGSSNWVRVLPFPDASGPRQPYLHRPGGALVTNPDGMFGAFGEHHVDLLALEHCSSLQNFYDKRSRYGASHDGLLLALPEPWRSARKAKVKGRPPGNLRTFQEVVELSRGSPVLSPWIGRSYHPKAPNAQDDWKFSVRSILCCYFLKPEDLTKVKASGNLIPRYEFVTQHGRIGQITHKDFREWLGKALTASQTF